MRSIVLTLLLTFLALPVRAATTNALESARDFIIAGKYPEALERLVWFHEHALETDPRDAGVRLSYALQDWVDLGEKYPKAIEALKEIRDKKSARLIGGEQDWSLFQDVAAINDHLNNPKNTAELFKQIEAKQPESAGKLYPMADKWLLRAGEYQLVRKYLGDPKARFAQDRTRYERGIELARKSQNADKARVSVEKIFTDRTVQLLTVLDKTGDTELARELQAEALKLVDAPIIKGAVK